MTQEYILSKKNNSLHLSWHHQLIESTKHSVTSSLLSSKFSYLTISMEDPISSPNIKSIQFNCTKYYRWKKVEKSVFMYFFTQISLCHFYIKVVVSLLLCISFLSVYVPNISFLLLVNPLFKLIILLIFCNFFFFF